MEVKQVTRAEVELTDEEKDAIVTTRCLIAELLRNGNGEVYGKHGFCLTQQSYYSTSSGEGCCYNALNDAYHLLCILTEITEIC